MPRSLRSFAVFAAQDDGLARVTFGTLCAKPSLITDHYEKNRALLFHARAARVRTTNRPRENHHHRARHAAGHGGARASLRRDRSSAVRLAQRRARGEVDDGTLPLV